MSTLQPRHGSTEAEPCRADRHDKPAKPVSARTVELKLCPTSIKKHYAGSVI
jgi:hypothetical protein